LGYEQRAPHNENGDDAFAGNGSNKIQSRRDRDATRKATRQYHECERSGAAGLLPAANLVKRNEVKDRWESGSALKDLIKTVGKGFGKKGMGSLGTPPGSSKRRAQSASPPPRAKRRATLAKSPRK